MFIRNLGAVPTGNTNSSDKVGSGRGGLGQRTSAPCRKAKGDHVTGPCHSGASWRSGICGNQMCREKDFSEAVSEDREQTHMLIRILDILGNQREFKNNKNVIKFFVSICIESGGLQACKPVTEFSIISTL